MRVHLWRWSAGFQALEQRQLWAKADLVFFCRNQQSVTRFGHWRNCLALGKQHRFPCQQGGCVMASKITHDILDARQHCRLKAYLRLCGEEGNKSDFEALMIDARQE